MSEGTISPTAAYMLRVAADEIEHLEDQNLLQFPHIARFIQRPATRFVLGHLQNFCWTTERTLGRIRRRPVPPQAIMPQRMRPCVPAGTAAAPSARVWVDVTNTYRTGFGAGIGRVALQLAKAGLETGLATPVFLEDGRVRPYVRDPGRPDELQFGPDIVYVVLDSFWEQIGEYADVCDRAKAAGARVVTCLHDVIPLYYPSFNRRRFAAAFAACFAEMMKRSDACITVSRYTASKVEAFVDATGLRPDRPLPVTTFHLGADGHAGGTPGPVRDCVRAPFARRNVFLSVGTLEPRKGYAITLDAFDALWKQDVDCGFVIIGRSGWISKSLERRILAHPQHGTRLHWLQDVADGELTFAYRNAHCLIQASITEGFGLPIVEANHEGTPVIATDVEVFRELAGDAIGYFRNGDSGDLAARIAEAVQRRPAVSRFDIPTWKESLARMVEAIGVALAEPAWANPAPTGCRPRSIRLDRAPRSISRRQRKHRLWTNDLRPC